MRKKYDLSAYSFIAPHFFGFLIFYIIPFIGTVYYSFRKGMFNPNFAGIENYIKLFNNTPFKIAVENNIIFMFVAIPSIVILSFFISYNLYELKIHRIFKLMFILPIFIPSGAVIGFYRLLFGDFLDSGAVMLAVVLIFVWKNMGYNIIIYFAAFASINKDILDYVKIDGANYMQTIKHVVYPMTMPATFFVIVVSIVNSFKVFKDIYLLQGNYPNEKIYMLQNFMNNKFTALQIEQISATANLFAIFVFLGIYVFYTFEKRYLRKVSDK